MTPDQMVREAHRLLAAATVEIRRREHARIHAQKCGCGHRRDEHTVSCSVNFTEGYCLVASCLCRWFILNGSHVITEPYL